MSDVIKFAGFDSWPRCLVCNKPCDEVAVDTPVERYEANGVAKMRHTGEIIYRVFCHGEKFEIRRQMATGGVVSALPQRLVGE